MEFFTLSLPEAAFLYTGLALQLVLRSSFAFLPQSLVLFSVFRLLFLILRRRAHWMDLPLYVLTSAVICILFWPEAVIFGSQAATTITAQDVVSYMAQQDPEATVVTAADTQLVPTWAQRPILIPGGLGLVLEPLIDSPLRLALSLSSTAPRPFAFVQPLHLLLGFEPPADSTVSVSDWVHSCYLPVMTALQAAQRGRMAEDFIPWENNALRQALSQRQVFPGTHTGISWFRPFGQISTQAVQCDAYLDGLETRIQGALFDKLTAGGNPLSDVVEQTLGISPIEQARFVLYREMFRAAGPQIPAPSLAGQYTLLRATGAATGFLGGLFGGSKSMNALTGAASGELERIIDGLSWLVGLAVFLTWYGPSILGIIQLVMLALFPIVLLWALVPGQQFMPLVMYFVGLMLTFLMPLWWVLVDQAAQLAAVTAPTTGIAALGGMTGAFSSLIVTVLGIFLIPVVSSVVAFLSFRSLMGMWRGAAL